MRRIARARLPGTPPPTHTCADGYAGLLKRTEPWLQIASVVVTLTGIVMWPVLQGGAIPNWVIESPDVLGQVIGIAFLFSILMMALGKEFTSKRYICTHCGQRLTQPAKPLPCLVKVGISIFILVFILVLGLSIALLAQF